MDQVKEIIDDIIKKIQEDDGFASRFKKNPIEAVKGVISTELSQDKRDIIVDSVKSKLEADELKDKLNGIEDQIKGLLN